MDDYEKELKELLCMANAWAHRFYNRMGYNPPKSYKLYQSKHPQELACWRMACDVMDHFKDTDMECVLDELDEDYTPC